MKNNTLPTWLSAIVFCLFFAACEKQTPTPDDNNPNQVVQGTIHLTANIGSQAFTADAIDATIDGQNQLSINGTLDDEGTAFFILIPRNIAEGEHTLDTFQAPMIQYISKDNVIHVADSGSITISSHSTSEKMISGSFTMNARPLTGQGNINISAGSFMASY